MRIIKAIFVGPMGLRSGWRLLIFVGITIGLQAGLQQIALLVLKARGLRVPEGLNAPSFLGADTLSFVAIVAATWIMARWEHRKLTDYGLPGKNAFGRRFWKALSLDSPGARC